MKEFMFIIRNLNTHFASLPESEQKNFLDACKTYIEGLQKENKLIEAQPLAREGKMISGTKGSWHENPFNETEEVICGYYHILAKDIDEAVSIAKANPEFAFGTKARIEVRPVKTKEDTTKYVYPSKA